MLRNQLALSAKTPLMRKRQRTAALKLTKATRATELWYKTQLLALVKQIQTYTLEELGALKGEEYQWVRGTVGDALPADITRELIEKVKAKLSGLEGFAKRLAELAAQRTLGVTDTALSQALKDSVKIDISRLISASNISKSLDVAVQANIELIKSIPEQYLSKVKDNVMATVQRGGRYEDIVDKVMKLGDVTESRAKLIARDQISKMNGSFNEARQKSLGINKYVWRTSGDERVRDGSKGGANHAYLDGSVQRWDSPPDNGVGDLVHPGEDYQCRCFAQPYIDLDALEKELGIFGS